MTRKELELITEIVNALDNPGDERPVTRSKMLLAEITDTAQRMQDMPRVNHGVPQ